MGTRNFRSMLETQWGRGNFVCVGLDSEFSKIPECAHHRTYSGTAIDVALTICAFNGDIVAATKDIVCAYKLNIAFYAACGIQGMDALERLICFIHREAPDVPVILDAKRGDIGNTNGGYVKEAFDIYKADAVTVSPYLSGQALQPFLDQKEKGIIVLCRTSNAGADELQDLRVHFADLYSRNADEIARLNKRFGYEVSYAPLYQYVAYRVVEHWNRNGNCALVVGATCPDELRSVRGLVGDMPLLIPGIGAQGGDVEATVKAGRDSLGHGMIINASRSIIFASSGDDFAEAARRETASLRDQVNQHR